jgi:protein-tyrosine phosphatase
VVSIPGLEGITPDVDRLVEAVRAIEQASRAGPVLVSSAAGRARGAAGVAAWLYATGRARSIYDALQWVRRADPRVHLDAAELLSCLNRVRERYRSAPDA